MKRFYTTATTDASGQLLLDGKPAKTKRGKPLIIPHTKLAAAIAEEWNAQKDMILPDTMPLTRLAMIAIDIISEQRAEVTEELLGYGDTDLLYYREEEDAALATQQANVWGPILQWVRSHYGIETKSTGGLMPIDQPPELRDALSKILNGLSPFALSAIGSTTPILGSIWLALALHAKHLTVEQAWHVATIDEQFQSEKWGEVEEQQEAMQERQGSLQNTARFLALLAQ